MDVSVKGAEQLEAVARSLKEAGDGDLRKELLRGLRAAGKPVSAKVRRSALDTLPSSGGLAARVAKSRYSTRSRLSGKQVGVRFVASNSVNVEGMDKGRLKHPVFARNRGRARGGTALASERSGWAWVSQAVKPGWFTKPMEESVPEFRDALEQVLRDVAAKIERSV